MTLDVDLERSPPYLPKLFGWRAETSSSSATMTAGGIVV